MRRIPFLRRTVIFMRPGARRSCSLRSLRSPLPLVEIELPLGKFVKPRLVAPPQPSAARALIAWREFWWFDEHRTLMQDTG